MNGDAFATLILHDLIQTLILTPRGAASIAVERISEITAAFEAE